MPNLSELLPELAKLAEGRDSLRTDEFAQVTNHARQTIRKNYCLKGECFGIRPTKVGNRLLWPVNATAALLLGEVTK